jgi:hypothetical protein
LDFVGFHPTNPHAGWYHYGIGPETRHESEQRAAKFYVWFCEYLNEQLYHNPMNNNNNNNSTTTTSATMSTGRNIQLLIGHGDFMSLVLKRIVSGFGHAVETVGIPHRSAFVHWNTGITELEYFGHGRFLIMSTNTTPHLHHNERHLFSGGTLKDGWSYLMPDISNTTEVSMVFSDEELDDHVLEQREALKALYLSSKESETLLSSINETTTTDLTVEQQTDDMCNNRYYHGNNIDTGPNETNNDNDDLRCKHFIVKRGLQVVGVASYSEKTGHVFDVAVRPSGGTEVTKALFQAVKTHTKQIGRSGSLLVFPRTEESKRLFESVGFAEVNDKGNTKDNHNIASNCMELVHEES